MIIELAGTTSANKGAELMAVAVREHFSGAHPGVQLAVRTDFGSYADRCRYAFSLVAEPKSLRWRGLLRLANGSMRDSLGLIEESYVDAVIDASGFAFSDQLPLARMEYFLSDVRRWKRQGKKIVLLPQALGPFRKPESMAVMRSIFDHVDLVFARDSESMAFSEHLCSDASKLRMAPDFTCLVKPLKEEEIGSFPRVCIVPNQRMIEYAKDDRQRADYEQLLLDTVERVRDYELEPVLFAHSAGDVKLVKHLQRRLDQRVQLLHETDAIRIKAELGQSRLVIGSRFHALVSALSQNVPAIATSWSHKYEMLFADYRCPDFVLPRAENKEALSRCMEQALGDNRDELVRVLKTTNKTVVSETQKMWHLVDNALGLDA